MCRKRWGNAILIGMISVVGCNGGSDSDTQVDGADQRGGAGGQGGSTDGAGGQQPTAGIGGSSVQDGGKLGGGGGNETGGTGGQGDAGGAGQGGNGASGGSAGAGGAVSPCSAGFVEIKAGKFTMGTPPSELPSWAGCENQHEVTLTRSFCMAETEVRCSSFHKLLGLNICSREDYPVETANWHLAALYCNKLSESKSVDKCYTCTGESGIWYNIRCTPVADNPYDCKGYRLPTEAEWEYAARAGTTTAFYNGDMAQPEDVQCTTVDPNLDKIAWYRCNSLSQMHRSREKLPNAWGLYDMLGNMREWVHDWYTCNYPQGPVTDPYGPATGEYRVVRGGSWPQTAYECRAAFRYFSEPDTLVSDMVSGFRPVITLH